MSVYRQDLRRLLRLAAGATLFAVLALHPACTCSENGHVTPEPIVTRTADDVVRCVCNLTFSYDQCSDGTCDVHLDLPVCLPPSLQTKLAALPSPPDGGTGADLGLYPDPRAKLVDDYCRVEMTNVVYHMVTVITGGWCDYKAPFAPAGGVGDSVRCFAYPFDDTPGGAATATDDGTCRKECPFVECDHNANCGDSVKDFDGTIHPDRCECSQIRQYFCPGDPTTDLPTALFCRPPKDGTLH